MQEGKPLRSIAECSLRFPHLRLCFSAMGLGERRPGVLVGRSTDSLWKDQPIRILRLHELESLVSIEAFHRNPRLPGCNPILVYARERSTAARRIEVCARNSPLPRRNRSPTRARPAGPPASHRLHYHRERMSSLAKSPLNFGWQTFRSPQPAPLLPHAPKPRSCRLHTGVDGGFARMRSAEGTRFGPGRSLPSVRSAKR
jgi:hypothetical protein